MQREKAKISPIICFSPETMSTEYEGVLVNIVGIKARNRGRSCKEHACCGSSLELDSVVRFRREQIVTDAGQEESALAVYWVTDDVDWCRVGFLPRHLLKHSNKYDGKADQIVAFLALSESHGYKAKSRRNSDVCRAVMLELDQSPEKRKAPKLQHEYESDKEEIKIEGSNKKQK